MPIIKSKSSEKYVNMKCKVKESIFNEIEQYCAWAGVKDTSEYLAEAAEHILSIDTDWKKYKKQQSKDVTEKEVSLESSSTT